MEKLTWPQVDDWISNFSEEIRSEELCGEPLLSVALFTYNHGPFVRQALESLVNQQTNFPFEVLIGDDASDDGTEQIIQDYQQRYPDRIRILRSTENLGKYTGNGRVNFIRTLQACQGKYVATVEGDDYWTCIDKLQSQVDFLEEHPEYAGSFHDTHMLERIDGVETCTLWRDYGDRLDFGLKDLISIRTFFHTSSFVARRDTLQTRSDLLLISQSGDLVNFFSCASHGALRRIPQVMSVYRKFGQGITACAGLQGVSLHAERIKMYQNMKTQIPDLPLDKIHAVIDLHVGKILGASCRRFPKNFLPSLRKAISILGVGTVSMTLLGTSWRSLRRAKR